MRYELRTYELECHQTDAPEQATRRFPRRQPTYPQRHLRGLSIRCAAARSAGELRPLKKLVADGLPLPVPLAIARWAKNISKVQ